MLLTTSLGSGSFENGKERKLAKNIYSSSDFGWIYGLLIGILHLMSMIIRELQEFVSFGLRGQKFIPKHVQKWKKMRVAQKERSPRLTARRPDKCLAACEKCER